MSKSKFLLIITILLMFTMSAYAQERGGDDLPDEIIWDVMGGTVLKTVDSDCNNNGIDDLDEFFPPKCFGQLTTDGSNSAVAPELDAGDIIANDKQCPDGWIYTDDGSFDCA